MSAVPAVDPSRRLVITPRAQVEALCRLALVRHLGRALGMDAARAVQSAVVAPRSPDSGADNAELWARIRSALDALTVIDPACGEGHMLAGMLDLLDTVGGRAARLLGVRESRLDRRRRIVERNLYGVEAQPRTYERAVDRLTRAVHDPDRSGRAVSGRTLIRADSLVERDEFRWTAHFGAVMAGGGFSLVIGNPPYVRHELIADPLGRLPAAEYKEAALAALRARLPGFFQGAAAWDARADLALYFTLLGCSVLRGTGVLAYVLPTGIFAARYGQSLSRFLDWERLTGVIVENVERRFGEPGVNTAFFLSWARTDAPRAGPTHLRVGEPARRWTGSLASLQQRIESRAVPLGSLGRLRYPIKTGINRFFYPDPATCARFAIEPEFLRPLVKSPREVRAITVTRDGVSSVLFHCPHPVPMLEEKGARGALTYIAWGETQRTSPRRGDDEGTPWPSVPSVRGRRPWYALPLPEPAHILCPRFFDCRFFFASVEAGVAEDQTFYGLVLRAADPSRREIVAALLNSSFSCLLLELHGRTGLGDGVRQYALCDMAALPALDPTSVPPHLEREITRAFRRVAQRPILPMHREMEQEDRIELDTLVCRALGLAVADAAEARTALPALVAARLERARRR